MVQEVMEQVAPREAPAPPMAATVVMVATAVEQQDCV